MILYQVISTYQLLNAIVHKTKVNPDEKCVLIISEWLTDKHPNYKELEKTFDKIIVMLSPVFLSDTYLESNTNYCQDILKKNGLKITDFSEIHSMGCHYNFGVYLSYNKIPHYYWEDAAGLLSRPDILFNITKKDFPNVAEFCKSRGLYDGSEDGVIKAYCNFDAQIDGFDFSRAINFDVIKALLSLPVEKQVEIREFFTDAKEIDIDENSVLILTQQLFSLCVLSFDEQALIYQLFVDYFFSNEKLVFKTHPDDFMYYGQLFPGAEIIRSRFPAEFLPSLFTTSPKTIATISSTAIDNLKRYYESYFVLGSRFEHEFHAIHKYATIADLSKKLCSDYQAVCIGSMESVVKAFKGNFEANDKKLYIVDNVELEDDINIISMLENAGENDVFAFINFNEDYCFYDIEHKNLWKYLFPVNLNKKKVRNDDVYSNELSETIYFFTKSSSIGDKISSYSYDYTLNYAGICINARGLSDDEKNICLLEALAHACENRLLKVEALLKSDDTPKKKRKSASNTLNEASIYEVKYSDSSLPIESWSEEQKKMRVLEGVIKATETRLLFHLQNNNFDI